VEAVECVLRRVDVEVVGTATRGEDALELVERLRPDLLVTDVGAADGDRAGLDCLLAARQLVPGLSGVVLSMSDDGHQIDAALQAGAAAYVLKSAHPDDLASAVRQTFEHSIYLAPPGGQERQGLPGADASVALAELTKRERQILALVAEGYSNAQLAKMLWVTEQTVKFHLSNTYRKLGVANRTEAARLAQLHGLVPTPGQTVAA
jgi:DNA-binding NarL/FixJ family response regulator